MRNLSIVTFLVVSLFELGCVLHSGGNVAKYNSDSHQSDSEEKAFEFACDSKMKEDKFVADGGDKAADNTIQSNPRYLTDISAVEKFAKKISLYCREEERPLVKSAFENCCRTIPNGPEQERMASFKRLHEYWYRIILRRAWLAAQRAARKAALGY